MLQRPVRFALATLTAEFAEFADEPFRLEHERLEKRDAWPLAAGDDRRGHVAPLAIDYVPVAVPAAASTVVFDVDLAAASSFTVALLLPEPGDATGLSAAPGRVSH
ncbi:hypothetical protein [Capillimicrobium parvum]|uniref:Uncharacterized protein n=1 Tax=Capillimicrobium parvum TaxID=2884022 RepID=A0A9E6XUG8_9ACTN|nr:hypothetical protein [Capillimicrobium parvum]UGS34343.1 hypothetical protein DSM104329_00720 [Capillimicrobium parvum]